MVKSLSFKTMMAFGLGVLCLWGFCFSPAYAGGVPTIQELTGGKVKPGDVITKDNVDLVKDLLDPGHYDMVTRGQELVITESGEWHTPGYFADITKEQEGNAYIDDKGNVRTKKGLYNGEPDSWWDGGTPFPNPDPNDPKAGAEVYYNNLHSYEGDDFTHDETNPFYVSSDGTLERTIKMSWDRLYLTSRELIDPKPTYAEKYKDIFFKEFSYVQEPFDMRGFGNLVIRYADASKQDDQYAFIPAMRRARRLSAAQKFDAFVGCDVTVGDLRQLNVPPGTWNYKLISVKPMLVSLHSGVWSITKGAMEDKTLPPSTIGYKFARVNWEVCPEVYAVECSAKDPGDCPIYSKKIVYLAGYTGTMPQVPEQRSWRTLYSVAYDKQGKLLKTCWNYYWGYGNPERDPETLDIHYETQYGCYDHQIDHSSPWTVNLPTRKFNAKFTPERFSIGYLLRYGR